MNKEDLVRLLKKTGYPKKIVDGIYAVDRSFFADKHKEMSYNNIPLPIGHDQTISSPEVVAFMLRELDIHDGQNILEIGSGSGYVIAVMSSIVNDAYITGIERIKKLADRSRKLIEAYKRNNNIKIFCDNGYHGMRSIAPFDRILVSAAAESIIPELVDQLDNNGILVIPVNESIYTIKKISGKTYKKEHQGFRFVPLIR